MSPEEIANFQQRARERRERKVRPQEGPPQPDLPEQKLPPALQNVFDHLAARHAVSPDYEKIYRKYLPRAQSQNASLLVSAAGSEAQLLHDVIEALSRCRAIPDTAQWAWEPIAHCAVVRHRGVAHETMLDTSRPLATIGRKDADIMVPGDLKQVSRMHAELHLDRDEEGLLRWRVRDCGSTHGTHVQGSPIYDMVRIDSSEEIVLGPDGGEGERVTFSVIPKIRSLGKDGRAQIALSSDIVFYVVEAEKALPRDFEALRQLAENERAGIVVLAVVYGDDDPERVRINLDELRNVAKVTESRKGRRRLLELRADHSADLARRYIELSDFCAGFVPETGDARQRAAKEMIDEVVAEIRTANNALQQDYERRLSEIGRSIAEVRDLAPSLEEAIKNAERRLEDQRPIILGWISDQQDRLKDRNRIDSVHNLVGGQVQRFLPVISGGPIPKLTLTTPDGKVGADLEEYLKGFVLNHCRGIADQIKAEIITPHPTARGQYNVHAMVTDIGNMITPVSNRSADEFLDHIRYSDAERGLEARIKSSIAAGFAPANVSGVVRLPNVFTAVFGKARFAVVYALSAIGMISLFAGTNRVQMTNAFRGWVNSLGTGGKIAFAVVLLGAIASYQYYVFRHERDHKVREETEKQHDELTDYYSKVGLTVLGDIFSAFKEFVDTIHGQTRRELQQFKGRQGEATKTYNNQHAELEDRRGEYQLQLQQLAQELRWIDGGNLSATASPFVQAPNRNNRPR